MYYVNYEEESNINYIFLICLYKIATKDQKQGIMSLIRYNTLEELKQQIKSACHIEYSISYISKELNRKDYN